jgi:urease accessory protein
MTTTLSSTHKTILFLACLLAALSMPEMAFAHTGKGAAGGFISGFKHPLTGWDHVAAMVAVGIWGAILGRPAIWMLPVIFPLVMTVGGFMGMVGIDIPNNIITLGIALSSILMGSAIIMKWRAPLIVAAIAAGFFAIFHGNIHGQNLPSAANPATYSLGFVLGSGSLHLAGITLGMLEKVPYGSVIIRLAGAVIVGTGIAFLMGYI